MSSLTRVLGVANFRYTTDELVIVPEGEIEFEIAGKIHHPKVGDELLIPGGAIHSARNIGTATAQEGRDGA